MFAMVKDQDENPQSSRHPEGEPICATIFWFSDHIREQGRLFLEQRKTRRQVNEILETILKEAKEKDRQKNVKKKFKKNFPFLFKRKLERIN
jgi:hypothetical protein